MAMRRKLVYGQDDRVLLGNLEGKEEIVRSMMRWMETERKRDVERENECAWKSD